MRVRPATASDNEKLIAIEQLTPQGGQIKLVSERKDYFFRAKKFADPVFLVAEDEEEDMILGIMGVGPAAVKLNGETRLGGLVFDWRSNPQAQQGSHPQGSGFPVRLCKGRQRALHGYYHQVWSAGG